MTLTKMLIDARHREETRLPSSKVTVSKNLILNRLTVAN